ncbi:MAG: hypothetical protein J6125_03475 [Clostridia bacterium]|nr:hypothetical protein [Clostridia bacterium]
MKNKTIRFLLWLATVTIALLLLCITASAETYDNFFVGGVAVTTENQSDIFGDGTASYDPTTLTLTLLGYRHPNVRLMTSAQDLEYTYSLYWGNDADLIVDLSGDCLFPGGVHLDRGAVNIHDASVTFGDYQALCCCVNIDRGALTVKNSRVQVDSIAYLMRTSSENAAAVAPFYAYQMLWQDSTLICQPAARSYSVCNALLYAVSDMQLERTTLRIAPNNPKVYSALFSQSGKIVAADCDFSIAGTQTGLLCVAADNPYGDVTTYPGLIDLSGSRIIFTDGCRFAAVTKASICGCDVEIYPYVDAFVVQGSEIGDSIVIENSTLVAAYHTDRGARTAFFNGAGDLSEPEATFGLYLSDAHLIVKDSKVTLKGFDCAVAAGGDTSIHLMEGSDLSLNAARAALLLYSFQPTPIVCDGETKFRQIELFAESQPSARVEAYLASYDEERAAMLSMLDLKFIAAAPAGKSVAVTGDAPADLVGLARSISGASKELYLYVQNGRFVFAAKPHRTWVLPVVLSVAGVAVVLTFVFFCFIWKGNVFRRKPAAKKKS